MNRLNRLNRVQCLYLLHPGVVEISVEKLQSNTISLKKYVDNTLAHEEMLNFRLWHIIPTTIGGLNATKLVYEHAFEVDRYGPVRNTAKHIR